MRAKGKAALVALLLVTALAVAGCSSGSAHPASPRPSASSVTASACNGGGTAGRHTITVDGRRRSYVVDVPKSWNGSAKLPVVYAIHGLGGNGQQILSYAGWPAEGARDGFITVAPDALGNPSRWDFRTPPSVKGSDAAFILALTRAVVRQYCADAGRQYLAGFSNGSAVAFGLACMGGFPFRAYGAVAGAGFESTCSRVPPTSFIYFHGTGDQVVPFDGGETPLGTVRPVDETLAAWARHDGCDAAPVTAEVATGVQRRSWRGCARGSRLVAYVVKGGGHTWPGAYPAAALGATTESISATRLMAGFFGLSRS